MTLRPLLLAGVLLAGLGCSTTIGTNVVADRTLPHGATIEPLGLASAKLWDAHFLWAAPADKELYEAVRRKALEPKGGDLLINAKVTTTLTSYLALFYQTEIAIEGTAAKMVPPPAEAR